MNKTYLKRETKETFFEGSLVFDLKGNYSVDIPVNFLKHMIETFARHGFFSLTLKGNGDLDVDQHHFVEDCGIFLGELFKKALGDKKGILRGGFFTAIMDDSIAETVLDIGGRPFSTFEGKFDRRFCGDFDTDLTEEFFNGFARGLNANIYIQIRKGKNDHHKLEAIFKSFAKALLMATAKIGQSLPSVKGII